MSIPDFIKDGEWYCGICVFAEEIENTKLFKTCQRHSPIANKNQEDIAVFPIVKQMGYCGDFIRFDADGVNLK